jgi:hypothetical protein
MREQDRSIQSVQNQQKEAIAKAQQMQALNIEKARRQVEEATKQK